MAATDVLTYHNDSMRSGQNLTETVLTAANVTSTTFGLLGTLATDSAVDAMPLIAGNLTIAGATHTVVYVASEKDTVYAYDSDTRQLLLTRSLLGSGEAASPPPAGCTDISPAVGVTATPVIDRAAGAHGTLFIVAMSADANGNAIQRLHALDLATLAEQANSPVTISATAPGSGASVLTFNPKQYKERGALLLSGGQIYTTWASFCDGMPYNGWIMAYNETSLAQSQVLNLTPTGTDGAIWNSGGIAADASGLLYAVAGNGTFDLTNHDYGNAALRLSSSATTLSVADYFTPADTANETAQDKDLGAGSVMLLPDLADASGAVQQLLIAGGKIGDLFLIKRGNLGGFNSPNQVYQQLSGVFSGGWYSAPAYFNGSVYLAGNGSPLYAYSVSNALLSASPTSQSATTYAFPGTSPAISGNGTTNAIVWAVESNKSTPTVLHAYNPANLAVEYYNSKQVAADALGNGGKFITPVIANGKVFVATPAGVAEFGPLTR